jgi:hypothetical protein
MDRSRIPSIKCCRTAGGKLPTSRSWGSVAEDRPAHLLAQGLDFIGIGGFAEALSEVEELLPLARFGFYR